MTIRIYPVGTGLLSQAERDQIVAWHTAEFSNLTVSQRFEWTVGGHFNVLLDVNDEFVGFVGLMKRDVLFDGDRKQIAGIRGLVIDPKFRKQGLGKILMREAQKVICRTLKVDYGFLLCISELEAFYTSLGWQTVCCPVFVENQNKKMNWTERAMLFSPEGDSRPEQFQQIDLMGKAF